MSEAWVWWKENYISMRGRINRKPFWGCILLLQMLQFISFLLERALADVVDLEGVLADESDFDSLWLVYILYIFVIAIPILFFYSLGLASLLTRRLNDMNVNGKFFGILLIALFVLFLFLVMTSYIDDNDIGVVGQTGSALVIILGSIRGTQGQNRYGPDPLVYGA